MENCWYQLLKDVCSTICCWSAQLTWWKKPILKSPKTVQNAKDWSWPKHKHKMFSATIHLSCHFSALKPPNPTSQFLNKAEVCSGGPWFLQTPNVWGFRLHDFFTTQKKQLWRKEYQRLSLLKWHTFMTRDAFSKHTPSSCPVQYDATFNKPSIFCDFFYKIFSWKSEIRSQLDEFESQVASNLILRWWRSWPAQSCLDTVEHLSLKRIFCKTSAVLVALKCPMTSGETLAKTYLWKRNVKTKM